MDDVVTHLPPAAAPELAGWYRSADVDGHRQPTGQTRWERFTMTA
jgi:hypothetical protein